LTFTYARDPEGNILELQRWDDAGEAWPVPPELDVEAAYDRWAPQYDRDHNPTRDLDAVVLRRLLPRLDGVDVLELGCGTGKNTGALLEARSVTAVDVSDKMLAGARAKHTARHVSFVRHDLCEPLPFDDDSFHLIVIDLVLEHLPALAPLFEECARVLRPGGTVSLIELSPYRQLAGARAHFADDAGEVGVPAYLHTHAEYFRAARAAGLRVDDVRDWYDGDDPSRPPEPGAAPRLLSMRLERGRSRWPVDG
jgi:ubiquinone/menaquinone biosynthesis C-methylase UbiE